MISVISRGIAAHELWYFVRRLLFDRMEFPPMRYLFTLGVWLTGMLSLVPDEPGKGEQANGWRLGRGMNLGNALEAPQEGEWGVRLRAEYFSAIKKAGFTTIRLPVRWSAHAGQD